MSEGSPEDDGSRVRRRRFQAAAGLRWLAARVDEDADDAAASGGTERSSSAPSDEDQPGSAGGG